MVPRARAGHRVKPSIVVGKKVNMFYIGDPVCCHPKKKDFEKSDMQVTFSVGGPSTWSATRTSAVN